MGLKITKAKVGFVVEIGETRVNMINTKALCWHLKRMGYNNTQQASIVHMFEYETSIIIALPEPKAS
jgi:hypothetical protein